MSSDPTRLLRPILIVVLLAVAGIALFWASVGFFRAEEITRANARATLYQSQVVSEIERFEHLPFILSQDPAVRAAAAGRGRVALNDRLAGFADRAGLEAIYLMDRTGETVAASNAGRTTSFLGQNYGFRPYFRAALDGDQGVFYGIGATTLRPGYFIAAPVPGPTGDVAGVIAIKLDLGRLAETWADGGERVLLANADGVVLLASDPAWQYQTLTSLTEGKIATIRAARQFSDQPLDPLGWDRDGLTATFEGREYYLAEVSIPNRGWLLIYLADERAVLLRASLAVVAALAVVLLMLALWLAQRSQRTMVALRDVQQINAQLGQEIEERRAAERRLKRTQGELERASKLAALGQLAASVTHELGQPIAAMRNHLIAAEIGGRAVPPALGGLVTRMQKTTEQLKFFARSGSDEIVEVDLRNVVEAALELLAPNVAASGATVDAQLQTALVRGNQLRLEQAATNILRNALDAIADGILEIRVEAGDVAQIVVRDDGPGLGDVPLEDLTEPFYTTRASGEGMGLGLAISVEIVREHGGQITARNRDEGGAEFTINLPLAEDIT